MILKRVENVQSCKLLLLRFSVVVAIAVGTLAVAGCSPDNPSETTSGSSASAQVSRVFTKSVEFDVKLSSEPRFSEIYKVGKANNQVFGVNILDGSTTINGKSVQVTMLGIVNYDVDSGPFGGFLVLTLSDGTVIGLKQDGQATFDAESKTSNFTAQLRVINGSDGAQGITGSGDWIGTRSGPVTTPIDIHVKLDLAHAGVFE